MDSRKELEELDKVMAKVAEEYETKEVITERCPNCNSKLEYDRCGNSFSISCANQCGFVYNFRGL